MMSNLLNILVQNDQNIITYGFWHSFIYLFLNNQLTPANTPIFRTLKATDKDAGRNKDVDFYIVPGDGGAVRNSFIQHNFY